MNLERLTREFGELISSAALLDSDSLEEIADSLESIDIELQKLIFKVKTVSKEKGITDSEKQQKQDAFLHSINHYRRENAYYDLLNFDEAVKELKRVIAENTDSHVIASAFNGLGHIYAVRKHYEQALVNFQMVVEFYPGYIDGYYNLGATYYNLKMYDEAINEFKKAINLDQSDRDSLLALSNAYRVKGNMEMSSYYYQRFAQLVS